MSASRKIQTYRWLAVYIQTALVAGLPFVTVGGESALRFDIPTFRLMFFGTKLWIGEFYSILLVALIFSLLIIVFTLVLGRVWCGWACPQTVLGEYVWYVRGLLKPKRSDAGPVKAAKTVLTHAAIAGISAFVTANLIWYFVSPYEMLPELFTWSMGPVTKGFFVVMAVSFYAHFAFLGQKFCGTICPYSRWQGVLLDRYSLVIAFDRERADECRGCDKCVTVCPTGIDIKDGLQVECINCARCVDACREMMGKRGKSSIVGYMFGDKSGMFRDTLTGKTAVFILAVVVLSGMLAYRIANRQQLGVQAIKDRARMYTVTPDGSVTNSYDVVLSNRGGTDLSARITVDGIDGVRIAAAVNPVMVHAGEKKSVRVIVSSPPSGVLHGAVRFRFVVSYGDDGREDYADAGFIYP